MKAVTVKQPWATLIALGEKEFETRSWKTKHRGKIAIHAAKKIDMDALDNPAIKRTLERYGYTANTLPTGAVIAIAELEDCCQVIVDSEDKYEAYVMNSKREKSELICFDEYHFGDYSEGRYAWRLANVQQLNPPIPTKGKLSLWQWEERQ